MDEFKNNQFETAMNAGAAIAAVEPSGVDAPFAIVPKGYHVEDMDSFNTNPFRRSGNVNIQNSDSLISYTKLFFVNGSTIMFADNEDREFKVIFNYHETGGNKVCQAGWGDDTAVLALEKTKAWKRWLSNDRISMSQLDFADFIEDNLLDIADPSAADIMEMVTALKVRRKSEFHSVIDQTTGFQKLNFSEETKGETLKGDIDFFGRFTLAISPFYGSQMYKVECRLRFRIDDNNRLQVLYNIINADSVANDAFNEERRKLEKAMGELGIPVIDGGV